MKKKAPAKPVSTITRGLVPTTAIASGLLSPATLGAPGDLDPTFGDMGRVNSTQFTGPAWSIQPLSGAESLVAGGEYCDYYCSYFADYSQGFIAHLGSDGTVAASLAADTLKKIQVTDIALQPDGKVVAVGQTETTGVLAVFRLDTAGGLDAAFANGEVFSYGANAGAQSVLLDPDGTIVVSGFNGGKLAVIRMLPNGTLDPAFGTAGVASGPLSDASTISHIVRTAQGGYRVTSSQSGHCSVLGLTSAGQPDTTFGTAGSSVPAAGQLTCDSMIQEADGTLLVAGQQDGHGFVSRLLASGAADPGFAAPEIAQAMQEATALAVDPAGDVLVAGIPPAGVSGALVVRLVAGGALDQLFANAGSSWVDLASAYPVSPVLHDMTVFADGSIEAVGGSLGGQTGPVWIRLVGTAGTAVPGVIGAAQTLQSVKKNQNATVTFRRTGGAAGAVSVAYATANYAGSIDEPRAIAGKDYTAVSGQLNWADGDRSDKQVSVPIAPASGPPQLSKLFIVALSAAQGGAEIGTANAIVEITGDGDPVGQFDFQDSQLTVAETAGYVQVTVDRNYYSSGATSVTVNPVAGTATSADFTPSPVTLSWADGDTQPKSATIPITSDSTQTDTRTFTVTLTNATNGALIGPNSVATISITAVASSGTSTTTSTGGGGALDGLALTLLGVASWLRRRRR